MKKLIFVLIALALAACTQPTPEIVTQIVQETVLVTVQPPILPTYTPYPTLMPLATYTPYPTLEPVVVFVTATETPTPEVDPLYSDKQPGVYLVGIDIAPGIWRSQGTSDSCYWKITDRTGDIIENYLGFAGGTMYVPVDAFQVELDKDCGVWVYLGPP